MFIIDYDKSPGATTEQKIRSLADSIMRALEQLESSMSDIKIPESSSAPSGPSVVVPTNVSAFRNDAGYVTEEQLSEDYAKKVGVEQEIGKHNTATDAHNDLRIFIKELNDKVNHFLDIDDTTKDQASEIVKLIEDNRGLIEQITTDKVNVTDIINNLTTNLQDKVLSASMGVYLKQLIDAIVIPTKVSAFQNDAGYLTGDTVGKLYKGAWIATETTGISQHYTEVITLPPGTYVITVNAPYCADMTGRVCIGFSAKLALGSGNTFIDSAYGFFTTVATFTTTTNLCCNSAASNNSATWSYLDRGGIAALRIA